MQLEKSKKTILKGDSRVYKESIGRRLCRRPNESKSVQDTRTKARICRRKGAVKKQSKKSETY